MSHGNTRRPRARLAFDTLEDRTTPAAAAAAGPYAVGVLDGHTGDVTVHAADGSVQYTVPNPYGSSFTGGVRVALADVNGDGTPDLVTAPGPGTAPTVDVFDGVTHQQIASFNAYESTFTGGVYVAAGDITGDGKAEIITGADQGGGPSVVVFDGSTVGGTAAPTVLDSFLAINDTAFRGGVRIALGDVNGDGTSDLVVGAGFGGGPRIAVFDGASLAQGKQVKLINDLFAFEDTLRNGVFPTVGDLNHDGFGDLIFGAGPGGSPRVLALDGRAALAGGEQAIANFFAGSTGSRLGVQVGTVTDSSGNTSIVCTDLSTSSTGEFSTSGSSVGSLAGGSGGPVCGAPEGGSGSGTGSGTGSTGPIAVTSDTATAVQGTYTGSGSGTLATFAGRNSAPTITTTNATITLAITGATLNTRTFRDGSTSSTAYSLTLTGTLTVTLDGSDPVVEPVTGRFILTADPSTTSGTVQGELRVGGDADDSSTSAPGVRVGLSGTLDGSSLTIDRFVLVESTSPPVGSVFASPTSASADKILLTKS